MTGLDRRRARVALLLVACTGMAACSSLPDRMLVDEEPPADTGESYLTGGGGPNARVDIGGGGEQLLARFQKVLDEKIRLEQREKDLMAEVDALRSSLQREQEEKQQERRLRAGAEAEGERLRQLKDERDLKILHLQMQVADLQREKLESEIAGLTLELTALESAAATPAPPAESGK